MALIIDITYYHSYYYCCFLQANSICFERKSWGKHRKLASIKSCSLHGPGFDRWPCKSKDMRPRPQRCEQCKKPSLFRVYIGPGIVHTRVLPGYVEIIVNRYKDCYLTTSIMESKRVFSWLMWIIFCWFPVEADRDHYIIYYFFWGGIKENKGGFSLVHCLGS